MLLLGNICDQSAARDGGHDRRHAQQFRKYFQRIMQAW